MTALFLIKSEYIMVDDHHSCSYINEAP